MKHLTHVRVNASPTVERVLSRRQHLAYEAALRRRDGEPAAQEPPGEQDSEEGS